MAKNILVEGASPLGSPANQRPGLSLDWAWDRRSSSSCWCRSDSGGPSGSPCPRWFPA